MLANTLASLFGTIILAIPATRSIYQVVTDRFATPNDSTAPCDAGARMYCGGSWTWDFDAVWISPVSTNLEGTTPQGEAFHGYWTTDLYSLNPHFGTADDLRALSAALHKRGMYIMLDVVVNHLAAPGPKFNFTDFPKPFDDESYFHRRCFVADSTDTGNQTTVEQCWLGDSKLPLPDLDTENPFVVEKLNDWIPKLVQDYGVDGLRIDTAKHIRKDFWPEFVKSAGVYTLGEILANDTSYAARYTDVFDAILDYPNYFQLRNAFLNPQGQFSSVVSSMNRSQQTYKNGLFRTASFVENHDQPRLASFDQRSWGTFYLPISLIRNAMTFPFVHDGIPIVYYGQEQGYQGGADPYNREALWFTAYQQEKPLVQQFRILNAARKEAIELLTRFPHDSHHSMVVSKPPMLALFTNIGSESPQGLTWHADAVFQPNEPLVDVLTCTKVSADAQGGVTIPCLYGMPQVLMPATALRQGGIVCPGIATGTLAKSAGLPGVRVTWAVVVTSTLFFVACRGRWMW
ncbi:glycoside hydrolase family 13 protein [Lactarius indigo]|nr:glycoside hydrolase family 13 protein [Lactarius indigo]